MLKSFYGLPNDKVVKNREKYGDNNINVRRDTPLIKIIASQFLNPINLLLIMTVIISYVSYVQSPRTHSITEVYIILFIIVINLIWGFVQSYKRENTLKSLAGLNVAFCNVFRDGKEQIIDARELVFDDVVSFKQGEILKADLKLIQGKDLIVDESFLTGESDPKIKGRGDVLLASSRILNGVGVGSVCAVGEASAMGKIAKKINDSQTISSFLDIKIKSLNRKLTTFGLVAFGLVTVIALVRGVEFIQSLSFGITVLIATIPEGLPTIISILFTIIAFSSAKKNALVKDVRKLETLGQVNYVCSDKTGTLTENKMTVVKKVVNPNFKDFETLTKIMTQSPTVTSTAVAKSLENVSTASLVVLDEIMFSSELKYNAMKVYDKATDKHYAIKFGAPEILQVNCDENINLVAKSLAVTGVRVLVSMFKEIEETTNLKDVVDDKDFNFIGVYGLKDPIKRNIPATVNKMVKAGINVVIVTGDHVDTAKHIAQELNIFDPEVDLALSGDEMQMLLDGELEKIIHRVKVFGRVTPEQKLLIVETLQRAGDVVAMLGDGTNDAIAMRQANVGVAMGNAGTDIAKEAADLIILDDDFKTINYGISAGRVLFDNVQKFLTHMLTINIANFIAFIVILIVSENPILPLSASLILWINFISDGIPTLTIGFEQPEQDVMLRKPMSSGSELLNKNYILKMIVKGSLLAIVVIVAFLTSLSTLDNIEIATTMAFVVLVSGQTFGLFESRVIMKRIDFNTRNNIPLMLSLWFVTILNLVLIYSPLNVYFGLVILPFNMLVIGIILGLIPTLIILMIKPLATPFIAR